MAVIDGKWLSKEGLTYFWSKIKAIFTKQTETNVIANLGAKNLFDLSAKDETLDTVGFTVNGNGTIAVVTTATTTAASNAYVIGTFTPEKTGQYTVSTGLSSAATGGSASTTTFCVQLRQGTSSSGTLIARIGSDPTTVTLTAGETYALRFYFLSGQTINEICKPMIRPAEITDDTFQPYAPTNRELYETRFASKTVLPDNIDLNNIKTGGIYNGVNSTGNSAMHMPVATGSFNFVLTVIEANEFIIQIFKQLNSAGDPNLYIRRFYIYNSDWDAWYRLTGTHDDGGGYGAGTLIPDNADLNSYTTIGKYYGGNSAGNTVSHLPVENGAFTFSLEVRQATPSMTYQYLRVCRTADDPYIYVRRKYISWGSWYRFTGSTE